MSAAEHRASLASPGSSSGDDEGNPQTTAAVPGSGPEKSPGLAAGSEKGKDGFSETCGTSTWLLPRHAMFESFQTGVRPYRHAYRRLGSWGMSVGQTKMARHAVWRDDMADFVLELMRRRAVEELASLARLVDTDARKYLTLCPTWGQVKLAKSAHRGAYLWVGNQEGGMVEEEPARLSTMDVEGSKFGGRVVVHNLKLLLGDEHMARLLEEAPLLKTGHLFLLGRQRTLGLQLKLWKLQHYMLAP
jgi:hypothetical protein